MINIPNYQISTQIYESANSFVHRAVRNEDNQPVILKVLKEDYPTPEELTRYRQEYDITRHLADVDGVVKAYNLEKYQNTLVMCLEDFGGKSLKHWLAECPFSFDELLILAIRATEILGQIHQQNIIHKDINPANLVFNPTTGVLKIIDFGIATQLSKQHLTLKNPNVLEGTLAYMSPEQTGRMNRALDYRTDFYSLGATFYELFTGVEPFDTKDALELVHCHLAKIPVPVCEINSNVPQILSDIVMKLMAKNAEERYQSAFGVKFDLDKCLENLPDFKNLAGLSFELAQNDFSGKFQIPQKLYGREREIDTLLAAFQGIAKGKAEMMLVAGYSGIGKSVLVKEIYQSLTEKSGNFIAGKFDQFQRNIPYSAIVNAFGELAQQLLTENEAQLAQWKEKLLAALGPNGQVIIDIMPAIELIIGKQPPVPELGASESQNRFNLVFQNFMRVFCQPEHPLVMFLDDLQWVDSATLKLLEVVMTDQETGHLFLMGAYRDNEVSPTHPLMTTLDTLGKENVTINQITLKPLASEHINQLIADSLHQNPKAVESLTDLVMRKTGGNPFFVNQFLHTLYEENLLTFQTSEVSKTSEVLAFGWQWNIDQIETLNITDNVVELMIGKLKKLPQLTQEVLRLAACVGHQFDLNTLAVIHEQSVPDTFEHLMPALKEGLVLPTSKLELIEEDILNAVLAILSVRFLHDRVQQAAYALIDDEHKKSVHLKIGRLLLQNTPFEEREEHLFDIVEHLNIGFEQVDNPTEKTEIAQLNLKAGQKAKAATAYTGALQYLTAGMDSLTDDCWDKHYELSYRLHRERCEVEYLNRHNEESEKWIHFTLTQAKSHLEKAELYKFLVLQFTLLTKYEEAYNAGRTALQLLGIDIPDYHADPQPPLQVELAYIKQHLGNREISSLSDEPEMEIPEKRMATRLLTNMAPPLFFSNQSLYHVIICKAVNINLQYGPVPDAAFDYSAYGLYLVVIEDDYDTSYQFGEMAVRLCRRFDDLGFRCQGLHMFGCYINSWKRHFKHANPVFEESFSCGLESGEMPYAGYTLMLSGFNLYYQSKTLVELKDILSKYLTFARDYDNQIVIQMLYGCYISVLSLMDLTIGKHTFDESELSEQKYLEECITSKSYTGLCYYYINKSHVLYLYEKAEQALLSVLEAKKLALFISCGFGVGEQNFYHSLILAALYTTASTATQSEYWQQLEANQTRMKKWADNCPDNYQHKYLLVEAEMARLSGKDLEAMEGYDNSIASAKQYGFIQNEALANELAAKFWLAKGKDKFAGFYLTESLYGYQLWGAVAKVKDLEAKYPQLLSQKTSKSPLQTTVATTAAVMAKTSSSHQSASSLLDLNSVVKASHALSGEIVLSRLLEKMMHIVIENAGASSGFLLLPQQGNWFIEAESYVDKPDVTVLQSIAVEKSELVSANITHYVARTQENVVLHDATQAGNFTRDPYIVKNRSKSLLCAPLVNQSKLTGLLYLENHLTTGAFTPARLEVLNMLSSQIAISIENSLLYNNLEQKVAERTSELGERVKELNCLYSVSNLAEEVGISLEEILQGTVEIIPPSWHSPQMTGAKIVVDGQEFETANFQNTAWIQNSHIVTKGQKMGSIEVCYLEDKPESDEWPFLQEEKSLLNAISIQLGRIIENKQAEKAIQVANKAKSTFLANMSHELRSPLNAILGFAQILTRSQKLDKENQENVGIISRSGEHLLSLINQVLDLSKIEAGRTTLNDNHFDFYRLLDDLEDMFHLKADDKRLQLLFEREPSVSQYLYADEVKVRQVLINLLNNALKFTVEGGITVRINAKTSVQANLNRQQSVVEFEIEDTGPGIASEELDQLFTAFVQTEAGKQSQEGTGLGLPISRKFVQLMGGDIVVNSEVGRGTTFKFQIQCQLSEATNLKKPAHEKRVIALAPNQPRYRILIVDDKWPSRQLLIKLLNPLGFELKEAENGQQAVEVWEEWQPHLIWMDMRMPIMNGYEATLHIREHTKGQATAIVALTASVLEEERAVILDAGCDDFLRKPFKENDIFDLMHKHVGVNYVYEDSGEAAESEGNEETKLEDLKSEITQLPGDLLTQLQEAVETADLSAILPIIEVIGEQNKPLANTLTKLVNGFRFDILQEVFED